jgi:diamine N-acetyltransferase
MSSDTHPEWLRTWSTTLTARDGGRFVLRLLGPDDVELLTEYFLSLSDCTRILYGPHPFDRETAEKLCAEREPDILRLVTVQELAGRPRFASYFILFLRRPKDAARFGGALAEQTSSLAPSVRDDLQSSGLGSLVMPEVLSLARRLGMKWMVLCGGVQARNLRGIHFYGKWGFRKVGEFPSQIMNHDMVREI